MIPTKRMPTVMRQGANLARVPEVQVDRSVFDRSHGHKTTFDSGLLIPIFCDLAFPGDTLDCRMTALARLTTPIKPMMDNFYLDSMFFAVPLRIIWGHFVNMFGEQDSPADSISFTVPQMVSPAAGYTLGSLADYFGLPTVGVPAVTAAFTHSALVNRAFWKIYNDWYRDENLVNSVNGVGGTGPVGTGDGPDANTRFNQAPPKRGKRFDYFTACLPSPQKGAAVALPLVGNANIILDPAGTQPNLMRVSNTHALSGAQTPLATNAGSNLSVGATAYVWDPNNQWKADLSSVTAINVNDLRLAIATQQFLERDARGGTRYIEQVWSHWRVKSSDARMQRSEYLGGGSTPIIISPVAQTSQAAAPTNKDGLANLAAVGGVAASGHGFSKSFEEHCLVIGIVNVRADLTYSQGMERYWSYLTRLDFPDPVFANIGEQAVLVKEIYCTGAAADNNVFGYQERFAEMRYKPSKVTNLFRPTAAGTLEVWHASEKFSVQPVLGQTFIEDQTETILDTRLAVPAEPDWYFDGWFDYKCARALPVFSVPGLSRL